jgi:hypothetical protein
LLIGEAATGEGSGDGFMLPPSPAFSKSEKLIPLAGLLILLTTNNSYNVPATLSLTRQTKASALSD